MKIAATKTYEHNFANVEDYIHHRPPYLMVDRILSIGATDIETEKTIREDEFFVGGHFPGSAVFPGAMMQELSTQTAGILIAAKFNPMEVYNTHDPFFNEFALGVLVKVKRAKFSGFARPGDTLRAQVKLHEQVGSVFEFSATVQCRDSVIMRNAFQLANVRSAVLQGVDS